MPRRLPSRQDLHEVKWGFELKTTREDNRAGRPTGSATTPVTLRVLRADGTGFLIDWIPGETKFQDPAQASNPIFQLAAKVLRGLHVEVVLDASGTFQRLRNRTDLKAKVQLAVDSLTKNLAESIPEPKRQQLLEALGRLLSPNVLTASVNKEVQIYFALYGMEFERSKPFDGSLSVPNPFGEGTLPSHLRVELKEMEPST